MSTLLTLSNLYPRPDRPTRGMFNAQFFRALAQGGAEMSAFSPASERCSGSSGALTPHAPGTLRRSAPRSGAASGAGEHGKAETRCQVRNVCLVPEWRVWRWRAIRRWRDPYSDDLGTRYLPVFYVPVIGRNVSWLTYGSSIRLSPVLPRIIESTNRRVIFLATWLYPDCVAAVRLAARLNAPLWFKVHGSDIFHLDVPARRQRILVACERANGVFCVAPHLVDRLEEAGLPREKLHYLPNGVDQERFRPRSREEAREHLDVPASCIPHPASRIVLFVGNLLPVKGPDILLQAFARVRSLVNGQRSLESDSASAPNRPIVQSSNCHLYIIGSGRMRQRLEHMAHALGMADSVHFLGSRPHDEIPYWMNVADCLCLPSRSEGMPNVVLEALAGGLPVVATNVGNVGELVRTGTNGAVVESGEGAVERMADALSSNLQGQWEAERIRGTVREYTWQNTAAGAASLMFGHRRNRR